MVETGKITVAAATAANSVPLPTSCHYPDSQPLDYYIDEVKNELLNDDPTIPATRPRRSARRRRRVQHAVFRRRSEDLHGLRPGHCSSQVSSRSRRLPPNSPQFTGALVAIDNTDGGVRAIANGRSFAADDQFDPAVEGPAARRDRRSRCSRSRPRSSHGYSPDDRVDTQPPELADRSRNRAAARSTTSRATVTVARRRSRARSRSPTTARSSAPSSRSAPATTATTACGPSSTPRRRWASTPSNFDPSIVSTTLGTQPVHPLEMASGLLDDREPTVC